MALDDPDRQADAVLLAAYAAGDAAAARTLIEVHAPRVHAHAMRMLGDNAAAEDVAQEAMMRLWKIAPDWRAGEALISTWLYRVTANLCTDRLRRTAPAPLPRGFDVADGRPGAEAALQTEARRTALRRAIAELPERQQTAIVLRHLEERANPEIAEIMALSVEAVESLLARGRRALSTALAGAQGALSYKDD